MNIRIVTPIRLICSISADEVVLPTTSGQIGILSNHTTMVTNLDIGVLRIKINQKWTPMIVFGGVAQVESNELTILVNDVEEATAIKLADTINNLEKASIAITNAETEKEKLDAVQYLKIISARVLASTYLS